MVQKTTLGVNTYRNVVRISLLVVPNAPTDPGAVESCGMHLNLTADEVLSSTRAVRKRLDLERPVEREIINECLELAVQAPSGSNAQGWHFVIVDDAGQRAALAALYKQAFDLYINSPFSGYTGDDPDRAQTQERVKSSAVYLAEVLDRVPVHVVPCITGRPDNLPNFGASGILGSILPAAWSFNVGGPRRRARHRLCRAGRAHPAGVLDRNRFQTGTAQRPIGNHPLELLERVGLRVRRSQAS